jgi:DNA-binding HxlR family transcriptional regulator
MMNRSALPGAASVPDDCAALHEMLTRLGDRWSLSVLCRLGSRRLRFKELHRAVAGISERMLSVTLRNLERDGLMMRTTYPAVPARVEYEVSPLGRSLTSALGSLAQWLDANQVLIEEARRRYDGRTKRPCASESGAD